MSFGESAKNYHQARYAYANKYEIGQLVDVGGFRLHVHCTGIGNPTVILDAGFNQPGSSWMLVQREVEKFTRVCSYDRAGYGLSESGPNPRTSKKMAEELHTLLHNAEIKGPYLLVGHSFGGHNMRTFSALYPNEVMGMILVDSSHEEQRERIGALPWPKPTLKKRITNFLERHFKFLAYTLYKKSIQAWPKLGFFSDDEWQYHINLMSSYKHFSAMKKAMDFLEISKAELRKMNRDLGKKPLIVITRGKSDERPKEDTLLFQLKKMQEEIWLELQKELAKLSSNSQHIIARKSGHMIPFEEPEIIVTAIKEIIFESRIKSSEVSKMTMLS